MLAIIPARGGSKGLPKKNIKILAGKPMIAYTIEAALKCEEISTVIVSTDDEEIARIAIEFGAECPFLRPDYLATDESLSIDVYNYTIDRIEDEKKINIPEFVVLQPTTPLRDEKDIANAIKLFRQKEADSVVSYCQEAHPIRWHKYVTENGNIEDVFGNIIDNRQTERPTFYPNGAIYIFKRELVKQMTYYSDRSYAYIMERRKSVDIDTIEDFEYVEFLIQKM